MAPIERHCRSRFLAAAVARVLTTLLLILLTTSAISADTIPGLSIRKVQICQDVQDNQPLNLLDDANHRVKDKPVWVWLLLTGTNETLSHLKSGQNLPLKTLWLHLGEEPTQYEEDAFRADTQPTAIKELLGKFASATARLLPLGRISKFDALRSEVEEDNVWGWRTASEKIHLLRGDYRVYFYLTAGAYLKLPDGSDHLKFDYEP